MTIFRFNLIGLVALLLSGSAAAQSIVEGNWYFGFSASENSHKLIYSHGESGDGAAYFHCEPGSGTVVLTHDVGPIDIREYQPTIQFGSVVVSHPYEVEWDELQERYYFEMSFEVSNSRLQELANADALTVDGLIYPIAQKYDGVLIREFARVCRK